MTTERLKEIFESGDYQIFDVCNDGYGEDSARIQKDGVEITAYPSTKRALVCFGIDLTDEQADELKYRLLERKYNDKKAEAVDIHIQLEDIEKQMSELKKGNK